MSLAPAEVGGVHVKYLHHCCRQLWLFSRGFRPEMRDDLVQFGNVVDATTFARHSAVDRGAARIDWVSGRATVHETKSSRKPQPGHAEQVRFYCLLLSELGLRVSGGVLHYPQVRRTIPVTFDPAAAAAAREDRREVVAVVDRPFAPERRSRTACTGCAYVAYCWGTD